MIGPKFVRFTGLRVLSREQDSGLLKAFLWTNRLSTDTLKKRLNQLARKKLMDHLMTTAVVVLVGTMALPLSHEATAADLSVRPPEALQQEWNDMMLAGHFGWISNGQFNRVGPENSLSDPSIFFADDGEGWVFQAPQTIWGIRVSALKERRYLLMSQGGWVLEGGLLRRIDMEDAKIELYGKTIKRHEPTLQLFPHAGNESWQYGHEFFLLLRSKDHDQAKILRTWIVADSYDGDGGGLGTSTPHGSLEYDKFSQRVTVKVMNGHYAGLFIERVDLNDRLQAKPPPFGATNGDIESATYGSLLTLTTMPNEGETAPQAHVAEHHGHAPFEQAEGWVNQALRSKESIRAETATKNSICLALLRRAQVGSGRSVELYVRKWDCGGYKSSYDFFLLVRPQPDARARILRQWKMTFDGPGTLFQRAFLEYDSVSGMALVQVTDGLDWTLLKETVSVSD